VTNASANLTLTDPDTSFFFGEARADAQGRVTLSYPVQDTVRLGVQVRAPGHVPEARVKSALEPGGSRASSASRSSAGCASAARWWMTWAIRSPA